MDETLRTFLLILLFFIAAAALAGVLAKRRETERRKQIIRAGFGKAPEKKASGKAGEKIPDGYFRAHPAAFQIDDITAKDLDLARVYGRADYTRSRAGKEVLWWLLCTPAQSVGALFLREDAIRACAASENVRELYSLALWGPEQGRHGSVYDALAGIRKVPKRSVFADFRAILLLILAVVVLCCNVQAGVLLLLAVCVVNTLGYYREKAKIDPYLSSFRTILQLLSGADRIRKLNGTLQEDPFEEEQETLSHALLALRKFRRGAGILMTSGGMNANPLDILFDYIRILLHLDLIKFDTMLTEAQAHAEEIDALFTAVGKIDVTIAAAYYRASLQAWCSPEFTENTVFACKTAGGTEGTGTPVETTGSETSPSLPLLRITDLYHPLIDHAVPNSIASNGQVLLTGSNASGKSTFLRAAALAVLLAESLQTVSASGYRAPFLRIFSSMALADNLEGGESYFIVEIRSLKRILDAAGENGAPVFCCIDEVLRGTNTAERIAASSAILENMKQRGILCFAATHDLELTELLKAQYENYHFEEAMEGADVAFRYQLLAGPADTRNAIRLLVASGYDPAVTKKAEERAEHFLATGDWK